MANSPGKDSGRLRQVLAALARYGLLMKQDKLLPSVVGLVTQQALASSWWSHPLAHDIFALLEVLSERSDVLETKLIGGKVTFVCQALWPAWLGVAQSNEAWQRVGLSPAARRLLTEVTRLGEREASGAAPKELEQRMLVRSEQRHTASGRHVLVLESWARWADRKAIPALSSAEGKSALEAAARGLGASSKALPWSTRSR
ncbi:MAG: hypothetical protein ABW061_06365 [Polyangiaceae bacterium]